MKKLALILTLAPVLAWAQPNVRIVSNALPVASTALESGHVLKASPGKLVSLIVTDTASEYILVMDSATIPPNGAVTLLMPPIKVSANVTTMITFPIPWVASVGIAVCNSSTGTFTKTLGGNTCIFAAQVE